MNALARNLRLTAMVAAVVAVTSCVGRDDHSREVHILLWNSNPLLKSVADTVQQEFEKMAAAGSKANYRFIVHDAGGQPTNASAQSKLAFSNKPAAVVALGSPIITAALAYRTNDVPFFFGATSDPYSLKLTDTQDAAQWRQPGRLKGPPNTYGLVSDFDYAAMADLILRCAAAIDAPKPYRVGYPINDAESNSVLAARELERRLAESDCVFRRAAVRESLETATATRSLIAADVCVIQLGPDSTVVGGLGGILASVGDRKIPILTSERESVRKGATGGVGIDFNDLGHSLGRMVYDIVVTRQAPSQPITAYSRMRIYLNKGRADAVIGDSALQQIVSAYEAGGRKLPVEWVEAAGAGGARP